MPSYTFVSTANAFVLRGAKIVFVDIRRDTMNIDESKIEKAITNRTKLIVVVHYAGVSCEMDTIMNISKKYNLFVVEDAAQGMMSKYKGKELGTIGHFGTYSFHETKNYTSAGEGGLLIINDQRFLERAEIIREKGTNRSLFFRGMVDKYSWVDIGSSYLLNDVSAAYLWGQLKNARDINVRRVNIWKRYSKKLSNLEKKGFIELMELNKNIKHNGHMFYIKVKSYEERVLLIKYLNEKKISVAFHYIPLHSSSAGCRYGEFIGEDKFTTSESERLIRLPIYFNLKKKQQKYIIMMIQQYYLQREKNDRN